MLGRTRYKVGANSIGGESGGYPFIYMFHTGPDKEAEEETEKERENVHKHEHPRAEHTKPQDEGQLKTKQERSAKPGQPENEPTGNEPKTEIIKSQDVTGNYEFEQPQRDSAGDEDNSTVEVKA